MSMVLAIKAIKEILRREKEKTYRISAKDNKRLNIQWACLEYTQKKII